MPSYDAGVFSRGVAIDVGAGSPQKLVDLEEYFAQSTQRLEAIMDRVNRGERVDRESHDWMLAQVEFILETVGNEGSGLNGEMRSNLLQLLLAVANLNQQMHRQTSL